jgi:predicted Zn-dependent protease with MMP-like domain
MEVSDEEFQQIMEQALEHIPDYFRKKLENIAFIFEDYPSPSDLSRLNIRSKHDLLGLYSGVPYTHRNTNYMGMTPDRIILFKKNIQYYCNNKKQLEEKIIEVVIHEIAHYFGMDEDQVRKAGY